MDVKLSLPTLEFEAVSDSESLQDIPVIDPTPSVSCAGVSTATAPRNDSSPAPPTVSQPVGQSSSTVVLPPAIIVEPVTESEGEDSDEKNSEKRNFASVCALEEKKEQYTTISEPVSPVREHSPGIECISDATDENEVIEQDQEPAQKYLALPPPPISVEDISESESCCGQGSQQESQLSSKLSPFPEDNVELLGEVVAALQNIGSPSRLVHALTLPRLRQPVTKPLSHFLSAVLLVDQSEKAISLYGSSSPFLPAAEEEAPKSEGVADEHTSVEDAPPEASLQLPTITVSPEAVRSPTSASIVATLPHSPTMIDSTPNSPGNTASLATTAGTSVAKQKKRKTKKTAADSKLVEKALLLERVTKHQKDILEMRHGLMSALVQKKTVLSPSEDGSVSKGGQIAKSSGEMKKKSATTLQMRRQATAATKKGTIKRKNVAEGQAPKKTLSVPAEISVVSAGPRPSCQPSDKPGDSAATSTSHRLTSEMLSLLQLHRTEEDQFLSDLKVCALRK